MCKTERCLWRDWQLHYMVIKVDKGFSPAERNLIAAARSFAQKRIRPNAASWEKHRRVPRDLYREAGGLGLTLLLVPDDAQRNVIGHLAAARVAEELGAGCLTFALPLLANNYIGWSLARPTTCARLRQFLTPMRRGEVIGAFCLTEPGVGSDAAAITTTACRVGEEWLLTGEKAWVTMCTEADFFIIYAQTAVGSRESGIALFLVERNTPGLEPGAPYDMIGGHALGVAGIRLNDVRVPSDNMLVPPGQGLQFALHAINFARAYVASMVCGMLRNGLEEAAIYVATRPAFGRRLADFQGVQWMLADVATDLEASRLLADKAVMLLSAGADGKLAAAHAKKFATRTALSGLATCMQVMGANGLKAEHSPGRHFECAKITQYLDGSTEIQNQLIGREVLRAFDVHSTPI